MLRKSLPEMELVRDENYLILQDGWTISVGLVEGAHVAEEAEEIISQFGAERPDAERLRKSGRRFEVASEDDPNMDRFNDYIAVIEAVLSFDGAAAFEPVNGNWI